MKRETAFQLVEAKIVEVEKWKKPLSLEQAALRMATHLGYATEALDKSQDLTMMRLRLTDLAARTIVTMEMLEYR